MTYLYVNISKHCDHSERENEEYGSWSESYTNDFYGVHLSAILGGKTPIDFIPKIANTVYLIIAEWSTGDSFGWADRSHYEVVHIFQNKGLAQLALETLRQEPDQTLEDYNSYDSCKVSFLTDSGITMTYHRDWLEYFSSLNSLQMIETIVRK
jgi:hypothetical protein